MDKTEAIAIQHEVQDALNAILAKHNLRLKAGVGMRYDAAGCTFRAEAISTDPALDRKLIDWDKYAESYGLPKDALGKEIESKGKLYKITGFNASRSRFPVAVVEVGTGKAFLFTIGATKRGLGMELKPWEVNE